MKELIKNNVIGFIVGVILAVSVGVYATIYYDASQINYKNTTLDHAIDDLYTEANKSVVDKLNLTSSKTKYAIDYGDKTTRTVSFNLDAGSYLVFGTEAVAMNNNSVSASSGDTSYPKTNDLTNCTKLTGRFAQSVASNQVADKNQVLVTRSSVYLCKFNSSSQLTVTSADASTTPSENVNITAFTVKLD